MRPRFTLRVLLPALALAAALAALIVHAEHRTRWFDAPPAPPMEPEPLRIQTGSLADVLPGGPGSIALLSYDGFIHVSEDDGDHWRRSFAGLRGTALSLARSGTTWIVAAILNDKDLEPSTHMLGELAISEDDARSWRRLGVPKPLKPCQVWFESPAVIWSLSIDGIVWRSPDAGRRWERRGGPWAQDLVELARHTCPQADPEQLTRAVVVDSRTLLGVSIAGAWRSDDGGYRWQLVFPQNVQAESLHDIAIAPDGTIGVSGTGGLFVSADQGRSWTRRPIPEYGAVWQLALASPEDVVTRARHPFGADAVLRSTPPSWEEVGFDAHIQGVRMSRPGTAWAWGRELYRIDTASGHVRRITVSTP